jgi:pyridoxal phosphate enzyme (YggS family)
MTIAEKIEMLKKEIPSDVKIVAVSKTRTIADIMQAYQAGQRMFGENKVQELFSKQALLPRDIDWHFIGHLQTNKIRQIVPFIGMIQSIDSLKLVRMVNKEALAINRTIKCLLQFHIATEETKFGLDQEEAISLLEAMKKEKINSVEISGVMGMATYTDDIKLIRKEFQYLKSCFSLLKNSSFQTDPEFSEISMGMSGDYLLAVQEGSTMIRVGTNIFGERSL